MSTFTISASGYSRQMSSAAFASDSTISASEVAAEAGVAPAALLETSGICGGGGIAFRMTLLGGGCRYFGGGPEGGFGP